MKAPISLLSLTASLRKAIQNIPGSHLWNNAQTGDVVDSTIKALLRDLLNQFGMQPDVDYVDNLSATERATDFVVLTTEADELITSLLEGKIVVVQAHTRKDSQGNVYAVKAHFRKKSS
ncbi:MAG: hypothetical protein AAGG51_25980 [Cyanobacteria bacterium P01_G01_bin.54]